VSALLLEGLRRSFGGLQALDDVTLEVAEGERHVLIGPNGAGKTTLFHCASGELKPDSGRVRMFGTDVTRRSSHVRARMGMGRTFQQCILCHDLTVRRHTMLALFSQRSTPAFRSVDSCRDVREGAEKVLGEAGFSDLRDTQVSSLSYGQQRRLEIFLALAPRPKILLLDEPTAGLAPNETRELVKVIQGLDRKLSVLMITHDLDVGFELADAITVLSFGRVIAQGEPAAIREDDRVAEIYLGRPTTSAHAAGA
jgi:branched-chain amino acid transport system ATP-binding protein